MSYDQEKDIERLLERVNAGDKEAKGWLLELTYEDLKKLAQKQLRRERAGIPFREEELVHEAVIRFFREDRSQISERAQFFALMAQQMRRILLDYARRQNAGKRQNELIDIDEVADSLVAETPQNFIALDEALKQLEELDPRAARVVLLRYFGGFTIEETATVLSVSPITVKRDWEFARAWLSHQLIEKPK